MTVRQHAEAILVQLADRVGVGGGMRGMGLVVAMTAAAAALLCSCDSSPVPSSPSSAVALDHCVVGTWKSTSISGGITIGGAHVTLSGGAGELVSIASSGVIRTDDTNTAPLTGTATDGSVYKLAQKGIATGTVTAAGGRLGVKLDQPTPLTVSLYKNDMLLQSQHPGSATDTYTCAAGSSLVITGGGGTVSTYAPG